MKKELRNVEIAEYVYNELKEIYNVNYSDILDSIDISVDNDSTLIKNENGNIELDEKEITKIKNNFLDSFKSEYEYK